MAAARVRRWAVQPDMMIWTETYGEVRCVSRQALLEAIMDGEAFLARTGGILTVLVGRHPTDLPGEAVTTNAVVEWKDGARATLDDGERPSTAIPEPAAPEPAEEPAETITGTGEAGAVVVPDEESPDGLDPATLEDEDLEAIPAAQR